jgi:hypothetical protein
MRFMVIMIPDVYKRPLPADFIPPADAVEKMGKFNEALVKAGVLQGAEGLFPPETGARVGFDGSGEPKVTEGRSAEVKDIVGGYWIWQVGSRQEAIEWAKRCPAAPGDVLEIRRIYEPGDFGPQPNR